MTPGTAFHERSRPDTGIPHPDNPTGWLVPPWPAEALTHDLVQHFRRFQPAVDASPAIQVAYYTRYAAELAATPSGELADVVSYRAYGELLAAITQAAASAQAEQEAMLGAAKHSVQLSVVRMLGLNCRPIDGQAL